MSLVVVGSLGIDTVETPGARRESVLGGSSAYFSAAASFFGPVRLVAAVGEDFPREHRERLASFQNIDLRGLETMRGARTFRWAGRYFARMNDRETLAVELNVLEGWSPVVPPSYRDSRFLFLANAAPATQLAILDHFPERPVVVADTMDFWIRHAREDLSRLLLVVDGLVVNDREAVELAGVENLVVAGKRLLARGLRFVVIKKGEHGSLLVHEDGVAALPAFPSDRVVDPTGAGDSFAGGLMGFLASRAGPGRGALSFSALLRAVAHATVVASFTIEDFSLDRLARLSPAELASRFRAFQRMLRVE